MSWLQNLPIKRKLSLIILVICTVALVLAAAALAGYERFESRKALARDSAVLADILGNNTRAALAFQDETAAQEILLALKSDPHVMAAGVYDRNGFRFSEYVRTNAPGTFPEKLSADGHQFSGGHLEVFQPIVLNGKRIGTIYLQVDLQGIGERLRMFGFIVVVIVAGSLLAAMALSSLLQRSISKPILALAETSRSIAERKDYTVRAAAQGSNEMGLLTDAFNQMLAGIDEREKALRGEINERKLAEARVKAQLNRLAQLHHITRAIGERQDVQSIFHAVVRSLEDELPADFCCVCLYDGTNNLLTVASIGVNSLPLARKFSLQPGSVIPIDENGLSRCIRGYLVYEPDIAKVKFAFPERLAGGGLNALVIAPLLVESQVFGVLVVARYNSNSFSSGECEFLRQLSEHVALAAHHAHLYSALQQAYNDLRQTQQAVMQQERLRALGQMASGIAHDINNAISPVALYTESLLEKEPNLSERTRDYLATIQRSVEDVAHTVSRMREFYRQREPQLSLAPVQLNRVVEQVADLTRARWYDMPQQRGIVIELRKDLEGDAPVVMGVESEIREALTNLVFNAVDAMPEGGTLTLRTKKSAKTRSKDNPETYAVACVEIIDTGMGMDEETRRRCLEPFYTTKGERGTGLGLAMVYGIVQRHSADIEIESVQGRGTTVRLSFGVPAVITPESQSPYVGPEKIGRLRLLIVDDDPLLIKSLRDILETDGHVVEAANGGQAGIEAFHAARKQGDVFNAVITDLGMPYVDGRKVASTIKGMSPATPVIMLTGWGQRLVAEGDIPPHVDLVLSKPPKLREIREALFTLCQPVER